MQSATDANIPAQTIKLLIAPEQRVNLGSKIVVMQNGTTTEYEKSGEASIYATHQEICLKLFEKYA